jgi:hypothetical protein
MLTFPRFDGDDSWKGRRDILLNVIQNNALAPYVIRSIDVGSEPLYDWVCLSDAK